MSEPTYEELEKQAKELLAKGEKQAADKIFRQLKKMRMKK